MSLRYKYCHQEEMLTKVFAVCNELHLVRQLIQTLNKLVSRLGKIQKLLQTSILNTYQNKQPIK